MRFREGDYPVDIDILPGQDDAKLPEGKSLVVVTAHGYGKRVDCAEFRTQVSLSVYVLTRSTTFVGVECRSL
jgi:hypothetical protein